MLLRPPACWRSSRIRVRPPTCRREPESPLNVALADGEVVELGNTPVTAIATPGHAPAHHRPAPVP
jgi:glyoxylase-like metal-dependent hydrolase (beta-lactamase superfamily II)